MRRNPEFADNPRGIMYTLLLVTNDAADEAIELISAALDDLTEEIAELSQGVDERGREIGVSDTAGRRGRGPLSARRPRPRASRPGTCG